MNDAVIVSTARTPLCKSWRGALNMTHGATMGGHVLQYAIKRAGVDPGDIDDVLMGEWQIGEPQEGKYLQPVTVIVGNTEQFRVGVERYHPTSQRKQL